jgi:hypothetical protein
MGAKAIGRSGIQAGDVTMPDLIRVFRKWNPLDFLSRGAIKKAQFKLGGVGRKHGEVGASSIPSGA